MTDLMLESFRPGFTALVVGASGGIGAATARALDENPRCGAVLRLDRTSRPGFDVTDDAAVAAAAGALASQCDAIDLVFDATGALEVDGVGPEKTIQAIEPQTMARAFAINAIGPALLLKHLAPHLPREGKSVFATLSARVGSIGDNNLGGWISYRASKAALNQIVRTAALEIRRRRPDAICVALHPGTVRTRLSAPFAGSRNLFEPDAAAAKLLSVCDRLTCEDTGGFFAGNAAARIVPNIGDHDRRMGG
ncbi:MAG: SDR family NAD(P)-dependent oxidoreductase, partial [Pseudomonadota bacterium]